MIDEKTLYDLYFKQGKNQYEIATMFNIGQNKVSHLFKKYGFKARLTWTEKDIQYLQNRIGKYSLEKIAKKLNKTPKAVAIKAKRLGMGAINYLSDDVTARELGRAVGVDGKTIIRWVNNKGLKAVKKKLSLKREFWRININDFWEWAEKNKDSIKWSRFEKNALGKEPCWVREARKQYLEKPQNMDRKWNKEQDKILKMYWDVGKTPEEIGTILNRSSTSIKRRAHRINLNSRKIQIRWKPVEVEILIDMKIKGFTDEEIAIELGRSYGSVSWKRKKLIKEGKLKWKYRDDTTPTKVKISSMYSDQRSITL